MKNLLILLLTLFYSSFALANYCDVSFLKTHHKNMYLKNENLDDKLVESLFKKMKSSEKLSDKLDLLEEQYNLIAKRFESEMTSAESMIDDLIKKGEFPKENKALAIKAAKDLVTKEVSPHIDNLITEAKLMFEKEGVEAFIKSRSYGDGLSFKYLELGTKKTGSNAVNTITRYKQRFKTQIVTFDLMENIQIGSAGFSMASVARIDLGVRGIRNLLVDDLITMVGKHEFHHAAFGAKRLKNQESIYHVTYFAKHQPLSSVKNGYNMYMSAEEVYNWANNSFWASTRIGEIGKYAKKDFLNDINGVFSYLPGTKKIAQQTVEITDNFMNEISRVRKSLKSGDSNFAPTFYTKDYKVARSSDEAVYFGFGIEELEHEAAEFISPKYRQTVNEIIENRSKIEAKLTKNVDFEKLSKEEQQKMFQLFQKEEMTLNANLYDDLLDNFYNSQKELHDVSEVLAMRAELAKGETEKFIKIINLEMERNSNFLDTKEAQEMFLEMRRIYRELGGVVKPGFKGYKQ